METKLKKSKQRDAILAFLSTRKDHPTADVVYVNVKKEFPNISLGTVYRNLSLLSDRGDILKLSFNGNPDRFDYNTEPHLHFCCRDCGAVSDLDDSAVQFTIDVNKKLFKGELQGYDVHFFGICPECKKTKNNS